MTGYPQDITIARMARSRGDTGSAWERALRVILLGGALVLGGCGSDTAPAPVPGEASTTAHAATLRQLRFNMSWLPQGSMAGVFVAIERGLYAEQGLAVEVMRGFGGIRTVNELDQGMFEFGYADPLAVVLNRAKGGGTRLVAALNQRWPAALCFDARRHAIARPADLAGLTLGGGQNSPMQVIVPAWLERNGVDPKTITLMQLDPAVVAASVVEARIDAGECWLGNSVPVYRKRAAEAGVALGMLSYADFGLDLYGSGLVTTDRLIAAEPATVQGFVRATLAGYDWAVANPEESVAMVLKHNPALDAGITRAQLEELAVLLGPAGQRGRLEAARVQNSIAFLDAAYALGGRVSAAEVFTTRFVDGIAAPGG